MRKDMMDKYRLRMKLILDKSQPPDHRREFHIPKVGMIPRLDMQQFIDLKTRMKVSDKVKRKLNQAKAKDDERGLIFEHTDDTLPNKIRNFRLLSLF